MTTPFAYGKRKQPLFSGVSGFPRYPLTHKVGGVLKRKAQSVRTAPPINFLRTTIFQKI